jgi:hypothetical protein
MLFTRYGCDHVGCTAERREVNNWFVVVEDNHGLRILHWDQCSVRDLKTGKHFCGWAHAASYITERLVPSGAHAAEAPKLRPPLNADGSENA